MYYKVLYDKKAYYSKEIVRSYLHIGDDRIQRDVMSGELKMCKLMDRMVYELPEKEHKDIDAQFSPVVQDLDAQIKSFETAYKEGTKIAYDPTAETYVFNNRLYIKFNAVRSPSKYREQFHLPVVEVCGMKFVALNCYKDSTETVYVG